MFAGVSWSRMVLIAVLLPLDPSTSILNLNPGLTRLQLLQSRTAVPTYITSQLQKHKHEPHSSLPQKKQLRGGHRSELKPKCA
ncbi:hypothetical protein EV426DRAFT_88919 [Tirmania nivea]|nr:hypothetical protein EV426DRAFT_88919 [Tirmania nivea]